MGNTQAKLAPITRQIEHGVSDSSSKRQASPPPSDMPNKRRAITLQSGDIDLTHNDLPDCAKDNKSHKTLRDSLDEDEEFLELPQLFDLVGVVAKKHGVDDEILHRSYRGQDFPSIIKSDSGRWNISMTKLRSFRPVTAIINSVPIGNGEKHKHEMFVLGREQEEVHQWLSVSYRLDTQIPCVVLRISVPSMKDSLGRQEPAYVNIFATHLIPNKPIRIKTGKTVQISNKRKKRLAHMRPRLLQKAEVGQLTETSLRLSWVDKDQRDVEGRLSSPVIVSNLSRSELDRMAAEVSSGTPNQPAHEQLLGLVHGNKVHYGLELYTEYEGNNIGQESAREANFCKLFRLAMIICNELGNFWAYRLQFPDISWTDESFPFEKLQPPRWTVKKWFARADQASDGQAAVAALPAQWQAISRPRVLPGVEEESFLRGLDAVEDDETSWRAFVRKDFATPTEKPMVVLPPAKRGNAVEKGCDSSEE